MGTTSEKLTYLNTTKGKIKDSINLTGANITTEPFRQYSTKLEDAYVDIINNGTDTLYNNFPKVSGEGTSLTLNNTYQAPMRNNLKGNTSQTGTPTPTNPIPVNVVSGDNVITISNQGGTDSNTYNIDLPVDNLFDKDNANVLNASISSNGTISSNNNTRTIYIPIQPSTTYTISKILSSQFRASVYDNIPEINSVGTNTIANFSGATITITSTSNSKYLAVFCYINSDTQTLQQILDSLQVEIGSKANSYTPYGTTPIELCKIGNYQDYFYKDSDKWYLHKEIGKVVLDGSEDWQKNSTSVMTGTARFYFIFDNIINGGNESTNTNIYTISNYLKGTYWYDLYNNNTTDKNLISNYNSDNNLHRISIRIDNTIANDVTSLTNWLNTHNTNVYYVLATPTNTEITDTTLINQLEELYIAKSKENQTNISQINNDLGFIISASALKKG